MQKEFPPSDNSSVNKSNLDGNVPSDKDPKTFQLEEIDQQIAQIEKDEARMYTELFNTYDKDKKGVITAECMYDIGNLLGKDPAFIDDLLKRHQKDKNSLITLDEYHSMVLEFDQSNAPNFSRFENQPSQIHEEERLVLSPDPKVVDFIRLLYEYQKKCEAEGKYSEAKMAKEKIEEVKIKEILRQENYIKSFQEQELAQVEHAQKMQFIEFTKAWDDYMADYEATAYMSLEKLKEKHMNEIQELQDKIRSEYVYHYKPSKQLIELRQKEMALVKVKKYSEAEKIKAQADKLEEWERANKGKDLDDLIEKKTLALRKQQQRSLNVLLKRIQKDRNQQLKNRQLDSQKLILKNRNLRNELLAKHAIEARHAIENIRNSLSMIHSTTFYDGRTTFTTTTTRRIPTSQPKSVQSKSPFKQSFREDSRMTQTASKLDKSRNEDKSKDESKEFRLQEALQESEQKEVETKQ